MTVPLPEPDELERMAIHGLLFTTVQLQPLLVATATAEVAAPKPWEREAGVSA